MQMQTRHYFISNSEPAAAHTVGVLLEGARDQTLDFRGETLRFEQEAIAIALDGCENITIENAVIDWSIPFSAEGTILTASPEAVTVAIDPEKYPHHVEDGTLVFTGPGWTSRYFGAIEFDKDGRVRAGAGDTFPPVTADITPSGVELRGAFSVVPQVGNTLVLRHGVRSHPGFFCQNSKNITLRNVTFHATCGLGALFQFCENITVQHVSFVPGPGRRVLSGHDDGLHFSNCRGQILVEDCRFQGLMDDPINVHGTSVQVLSHSGGLVQGRFGHPQSIGFATWAAPGDQLSILDCRTLNALGTAVVKSFSLSDPVHFTLELDRPLPAGVDLALENLTNTPRLLCRRNFFGSCRARGLLVTTPRTVVIEDNTFESSGSAILLSGDANAWYESGVCRDVTIRRNRFFHCLTSYYQFCEGVISLCPEIPDKAGSSGFHENIAITDNLFDCPGVPALYAHCARQIRFSQNTLADGSDLRQAVKTQYCTIALD